MQGDCIISRRPKYNHVRVTLTPTPPLPKTWTTPTYQLERYNIRRNVKTVNVQLHGLRGSEKRTESISFPLLALGIASVVKARDIRGMLFPMLDMVHIGLWIAGAAYVAMRREATDTPLADALVARR